MGYHAEKNENKNESEQPPVYFIPGTNQDFINKVYHDHIHKLELRINRLERIIDALDRRLEGNARHPEDEGWFD